MKTYHFVYVKSTKNTHLYQTADGRGVLYLPKADFGLKSPPSSMDIGIKIFG